MYKLYKGCYICNIFKLSCNSPMSKPRDIDQKASMLLKCMFNKRWGMYR